jgi:hypothetical protein
MPNPFGAPESQEAEDILVVLLQSAATGNVNGTVATVPGYSGPQTIEVNETAGGTCTLSIEGSFDGVNWYAVGYFQVDNILAPARAVAAISVAASSKHVYSLLDNYSQIRARISAVAGGCTLTATLRANPV